MVWRVPVAVCYTGGMRAQVQLERKTSVREAQASQAFPSNEPQAWERQPGESIQAYARFVAYRNTPPSERSMRKLGISAQLAFRWAKRWHWTKRATVYDDWQLELGDGLATTAQLGHRLAVVRLGSAFIRQATAKVSEVKLSSIDDLVNLAKAGVAIERQGLGLTDGDSTPASRAPVAQVAVSFGSAPPWLAGQGQAGQNEAKLIEAKVNEPVVPYGEQVIARPPLIGGRARLAERKVNCPKGKS